MALLRRQFLLSGLGTLLTAASGVSAHASSQRILSFENLHTGESLKAAYWADGAHVPDACHEINRLLRDHRTGDVTAMSTRLLDVLFTLKQRLHADAPFEVISGYRSPRTNAALARANSGVATKSLHTRGMAVDIRLPGCPLKRLRDEAAALRVGGVGYYPKSNFVHVDVGRVRYW